MHASPGACEGRMDRPNACIATIPERMHEKSEARTWPDPFRDHHTIHAKMTMTRIVILSVFVALSTTLCAQAPPVRYDYRWIEFSDAYSIYVVSPDSASRRVKLDQDLRKDLKAEFRMALRIIQGYEAQGWELFNVAMDKERYFLLRMPKE